MGHVKINFLLDSRDIAAIAENYSQMSYEERERFNIFYNKYSVMAERYGLARFKDIPTEGEDFVLDFNTEELGDSIDWDAITYPSERIRELVRVFINLHPVHEQLKKLKDEIGRVTFDNKYALSRLGAQASSMIHNAPESIYLKYSSNHKAHSLGALHHTLNKEVEIVESLKNRDSQVSKKRHIESAIRHLTADIDSYMLLMFWVDDEKQS